MLVVNDKNVVEQRPVETGDEIDGGMRIIKSGLKPEDRVVVSGIQRAVPGSVVKPVDARRRARRLGPCRAGTCRAAPRPRSAQGQAMIAKFFIERPVLANVIAVLTIILGLVALARLPVAQYPNIVPPTVQVTARYPGASAATVVRDVALPIEQKVNGVEGMIYMSSMSTSDGSYTLTVTFRIGTDADKAQILVQNRVASALPSLPQSGAGAGRADREALDLDPRDRRLELAGRPLRQPVSVELCDHQPARRGRPHRRRRQRLGVRRRPVRHAALARPAEAAGAQAGPRRRHQRRQPAKPVDRGRTAGHPAGPAGSEFQYTINVPSKLDDVSQFEDIIIKADTHGQRPHNAAARCRPHRARRPAVQPDLQAQRAAVRRASPSSSCPEANALDVAKRVEKRMQQLQPAFPPGMTWNVPFDTTKFVSAAIHEVYKTLIEAAVLVLIVILVFLQDWRATLVPATTVPVTIIGAFAAMAAFGFSVNLTTCSPSFWRSASSSTTRSWWSRARPSTSSTASPRTTRRSRPCTSCSVPSSASLWC